MERPTPPAGAAIHRIAHQHRINEPSQRHLPHGTATDVARTIGYRIQRVRHAQRKSPRIAPDKLIDLPSLTPLTAHTPPSGE